MTRDDIYTPLLEAKDEIRRRWANRGLRRKVEEYLHGQPPGVSDEPRAFLSRTVHTPNREFCRYIELASATGLAPAPMEFIDDRFCNCNPDKLGRVRMTFFRGMNRHGEPIIQRKMIASGNIDGAPFRTIQTLWHENLIGFHERILRSVFPAIVPENESAWLRVRGATPMEFYPAHFARFICHGVLFESYLRTSRELTFTEEVVLPAFQTVCSLFNTKPLIVRLLPEESADDPAWTWYEAHIARLIGSELHPTSSSKTSR